VLSNTNFTRQELEEALRNAAQQAGMKAGPFFSPIRVAVTGRKNAPPLFETLEVLGRDTTLARIDQAIHKIQAVRT
jgi:glutamyl-tRNA synthetase